MFVTDGQAVGLRKDLNGVLLLDSALQTPVTNTEEIIVIELPYLEVSRWRKSSDFGSAVDISCSGNFEE